MVVYVLGGLFGVFLLLIATMEVMMYKNQKIKNNNEKNSLIVKKEVKDRLDEKEKSVNNINQNNIKKPIKSNKKNNEDEMGIK